MKDFITKIIKLHILMIATTSLVSATTDTWYANGNVVTDVATGLVWQRQDDGVMRTYLEAINYCQDISLDSSTSWRLPNVKELMSIVDYRTEQPAIDEAAFIGTILNSGYWSTSRYALGIDRAWFVQFFDGFVGFTLETDSLYVRSVR